MKMPQPGKPAQVGEVRELDPRLAHGLHELVPELPGADRIRHDSASDAAFGGGDEQVAKAATDRIIGKDKNFRMNVVTRSFDGLGKGIEAFRRVDENLCAITRRGGKAG